MEAASNYKYTESEEMYGYIIWKQNLPGLQTVQEKF